MTIEERIDAAQNKAERFARWADNSADEAAGAELIGLPERAERCRDQSARHEEDAAVWSATARKLRERQQAIARRYATERQRVHVAPGCAADGSAYAETQAHAIDAARPAVSLAAADGTPFAEDQAHALDAERNEALGLYGTVN
jgi:hypothetical protein